LKSTFLNRLPITVLGIPLITYLVITGGLYFAIFICLTTILALFEFYDLKKRQGIVPQQWLGYLGIIPISYFYFQYPHFDTRLILSILLIFIFLVISLEIFRNIPNPLENISITITGVMYLGLFLGSMIAIRNWDSIHHSRMTMAMIITVWICDSAAFLFGKGFGKRKLIERVSPNKTIAGGVGGLIGAFTTVLILDYYGIFGIELALKDIIILALITGVFGQLGDFAESLLKRDASVKDSGRILLGHGGVFDRFDSLLFTSPLTLIFLENFLK